MARALTSAAVLASLASVGNAFVQPAAPLAGFEPQSSEAATRYGSYVPEPEAAQGTSAFGSVCAGLALGLAVSMSSMGAVHAEDKKAAAAPPPPPPVNLKVMPDHRTSTAAEMKAWQKAWGKAQFKEKTEMQLNQAYALPTTGAGRYKQFGIDSGSPIRQIPEADSGTYPMRPSQKKPAPDAALLARVKPFLNEGKYGNFYSPSSPYLYAPN